METESFALPVLDVVEETADARSIVLGVPPGLEERFAHRPGQFLTVAVPTSRPGSRPSSRPGERTGVVARCYSIASSPSAGGPLTITVKRTADGYASGWLCDHVRPGDTLRVQPPSGIFTPDSLDADLLLLAAGSGITPVVSIVRTALAQGSGHVVLVYANRDEASVIFRDELDALAEAHPDRLRLVHWLESERGLPTQEDLRALAAPYASYDAFVCGPAPFMKLATGALRELGLPRARRHQERFVSLDANPFGDLPEAEVAEREIRAAELEPGAPSGGRGPSGPARLEVEMDGREHAFDDWQPGTRMLDHLESKGLAAPHSCRQGECAACVVRLVSGEVRMLANDVLGEADLGAGYRLGCQSVPHSATVRVRYD